MESSFQARVEDSGQIYSKRLTYSTKRLSSEGFLTIMVSKVCMMVNYSLSIIHDVNP